MPEKDLKINKLRNPAIQYQMDEIRAKKSNIYPSMLSKKVPSNDKENLFKSAVVKAPLKKPSSTNGNIFSGVKKDKSFVDKLASLVEFEVNDNMKFGLRGNGYGFTMKF